MRPLIRVLCLGTLLFHAGLADAKLDRMRVGVPVLDVRKTPERAAESYEHDPNEETQLLYGELVIVHAQQGAWARIEALEQAEWTHGGHWEGYPGWVEVAGLVPDDPEWQPNLVMTDAMVLVHRRPHEDQTAFMKFSLGTRAMAIEQIPDWYHVRLLDGQEAWIYEGQATPMRELALLEPDERRARITAAAHRLIGTPYYWGGRSATLHGLLRPPNTAVDCSGLTNLCYRAAGLDIPRDAHEQFLKAKPIPLSALRPGDLIFLSDPDKPDLISHVMVYIGEGRGIEGPGTGGHVRQVTMAEKLDGDWARFVAVERKSDRRRVAAGTFLP